MTAPAAEARLRITTRSILLSVGVIVAGMGLLGVLDRSERVVMWVLVAAVAAGVVHPVVGVMAGRVPRGLAIAVVTLVAVTALAFLSYALVDGITRETRALQEAAPRLADRIETSGRYAGLARQIDLAERTRVLVSDIPKKLTGGTGRAIHTAADYALTVSIVAILAIFFLIQGPGLVRAGVRQWPGDLVRRARLELVVLSALRRGFAYLRRALAMAVVVGLVAFGLAALARLPAPIPLALWVAMWSLLPLAGTIIGALPLIGLGAVESAATGLLLAGAFVLLHVGEAVVQHYWIDKRTVPVGPFLGLLAIVGGFEWRSVAGVLVVLLFVAFAAAVADEVGHLDDHGGLGGLRSRTPAEPTQPAP